MMRGRELRKFNLNARTRLRECDAAVCWRSRDVSFVFSRGKERYALRDSDMRDVAAKISFSFDHGSSAFENG